MWQANRQADRNPLHGFLESEDGKITDNWVMVDFPHVLAQLGVDVFDGKGWENTIVVSVLHHNQSQNGGCKTLRIETWELNF